MLALNRVLSGVLSPAAFPAGHHNCNEGQSHYYEVGSRGGTMLLGIRTEVLGVNLEGIGPQEVNTECHTRQGRD